MDAYTIFSTSLAATFIIGFILVIGIVIAYASDCEHPVFVSIMISLTVLWFAAFGTAAITALLFSPDLNEKNLEIQKTSTREYLLKQCPQDVEGICHVKWLEYHADSLRSEYKVQKDLYE